MSALPAQHLVAAPQERVEEFAVCESRRLLLRPGTYRFFLDRTCPACWAHMDRVEGVPTLPRYRLADGKDRDLYTHAEIERLARERGLEIAYYPRVANGWGRIARFMLVPSGDLFAMEEVTP